MTLYEIKDNYLNALNNMQVDEETGEIINIEELEQVEGDFRDKVEAVACYIKDIEAQAKAIGYEEKVLKERREAKENKADRLREYLKQNMLEAGMMVFEAPKCRLSFRSGQKTIIDDESILPEQYVTYASVRKVDKNAIKDAIRSGEEVPGAHLIDTQSLQVK